MPNWRLLQNNGSFSPSGPLPALEMCPDFSFTPTISTSNYSIHGQYTDLDSLVSSHTRSGGNSALQRGLNFLSSKDGSDGNLVLDASLQAPSLIGTNFSSVGSECPRVFCLSGCGDLHLSNTGLLGIRCSCHGSHMSVSNFCKHSGLSDVNPGYAVHTETGECIAQWRKLYLKKFGIRAPDDHRGWDWPEGLLTTSSLLRSNTTVPQGGKVFDLSSLFASSAESITSSQPGHNVSPSNLQSSHDFADKMSKTEHPINPRNSRSMMDSPVITCHEPSSFMTSRVGRGGSRNDCQLSSLHSKTISTSGNLFSLPYQNVQSTGSKMNNNLNDEIVPQKGALLSSTELKLGQPSQQGWCVGSTTSSAMRSNIRDLQTSPVQEQVTNKLGSSKVVEQGKQALNFQSATDLWQTKEQFQQDILNNAQKSAHTTSSLKHSRDCLYNSSEKSVPILSSNTAAGGSSVHHQENNKGINESRNFIPWKLHSQSYVDKSSLMEFAWNGSERPIRPLGIQGSVLQKKQKSTKITKYATVESESSKLYVHQMENSGILTKGVKHSHPNSCAIPNEKVYSFGMAGMLPDAYFHSNRTGNVGSLDSLPDPGHVSSSLGFGVTKTMHTRSLGSTPLTTTPGIGHDSASPNMDVHAVNSQRSDESWRFLTLGSTDQRSMGLNRQPRIHHDQREPINNCNISDVGVGSSFLDPRPSRGRYDHLCNTGHDMTQTFLLDIGDKKAGNDGHETMMEGHNWDGLRVFMCSPSNTEVMDKYAQGPCAPRPKEPCSPSLGRGGNDVSGCMLPRCCQGSHSHILDSCCCTDPSICSNREWHAEDTSVVNRLEKQVGIAVVKASKLEGSLLSDNSTAIEKAVMVEYDQKMKEQMCLKLDCMGSQWRHIPPKANPISELRCLNSLEILPGKKGEFEIQLNGAGAKGVSSDQIVEFQEIELSKFSSGSSTPAVTHVSNEVDDVDCRTVDAIDTAKCNDQLVDHGSVIINVDAIDSGKSCQDAYCGKASSIEEESSEKLPNVPSHGCADAFKLSHSESNELLNSGDSGSDYGRVSNTMHKNENGSTPRKRKHRMKWKTMGPPLAVSYFSLKPSESPLQTRNKSENHAHASEDVHTFRQSNHDPSNILDANIKYSSFKRRCPLSSVKMLSHKRDLKGIYNTLESGHDDQRLLRGHGNSVVMPENIAGKRLRLVEAAISVMTPVKAAKHTGYSNPDTDGTLTCSLQLQKPVFVSHSNVCNEKEKPIACGKYGILCNRELDLDQLKPPKIVPLTQVLKSSTKRSKFANDHKLASVRNLIHFSDGRKMIYGCSTHDSGQVRKLLSCEVGFCETSAQTLQTYHKENAISPNDCSTPGQVGVDQCKSNPNLTNSHPSAQSKQKESRVRSLFELSMKGKECLSADFSLCQTVISMECEPERKGCKSTEESNGAECSSFARRSLEKPARSSVISELDALCCICGISSNDKSNCLLECGRCFIQVHQGCYGISRVPKGDWYCRPCNTGAKNVACVLCGYGGGAMTRAFGSRRIVKSLLKARNYRTESHIMGLISAERLYVQTEMELESARFQSSSSIKPVMHNSIIAGSFDRTVRQWVHMVCGLWTPGSRCSNVASMSAFDVSDVSSPKPHMVCNICKRSGGSCTQCYVETCSSYVHPWCSHQKGLFQSDVEGGIHHTVRFSGRCLLHANHQPKAMESDNDTVKVDSETEQEKEPTCARTEVYRGKNLEGGKHSSCRYNGKVKCLVSQVQLDAWLYINRQKLGMNWQRKPPVSDADHDYRKEYARYKQAKGWKQLVVYKSGIHALGLYTSQFIPRSAMVVEYIGEIVGPRVADKRESEYLGGRKLQYKGACYFFRIDKEQIIDATRKGGIARFVNHSCQPNCVAKVITVRSEKKVVFFAQRDIDPGEEITYDYHFNNEDEGKKIPCFCKSRNCRRYLN